MKTRATLLLLFAGMTSLAFVGQAAFSNYAQEDEDDEETMALSKAPAAVRAAIERWAPAGQVPANVTFEGGEGHGVYEAECGPEGSRTTVSVSKSGELVEIEKEMAFDALPEAARKAVSKAYPSAVPTRVESVEKHSYDVRLMVAGQRRDVSVSATGEIEGAKYAESEEDEDGD